MKKIALIGECMIELMVNHLGICGKAMVGIL